jgi:hypothetical protein
MEPTLTPDELAQRMTRLILGGHLGPAEGKGVLYDTVGEDHFSTIFIAAVISLDGSSAAFDRFLIRLAKKDGAVLSTTAVSLKQEDIAEVLRSARCGTLLQAQ